MKPKTSPFLVSLLQLKGGWGANQALQRKAARLVTVGAELFHHWLRRSKPLRFLASLE
jgi:hypothetical protein